jgi:hypothetical protein
MPNTIISEPRVIKKDTIFLFLLAWSAMFIFYQETSRGAVAGCKSSKLPSRYIGLRAAYLSTAKA